MQASKQTVGTRCHCQHSVSEFVQGLMWLRETSPLGLRTSKSYLWRKHMYCVMGKVCLACRESAGRGLFGRDRSGRGLEACRCQSDGIRFRVFGLG
jgi:hypothetical protein